jgi:eukaryotic-like serine/threonine-protein kinase
MSRTDSDTIRNEAVAWFQRLIELDSSQQRVLLRQLRQENPALAQRVEQLVAADSSRHGILEQGLAVLAPQALHQTCEGGLPPNAHQAGELVGPWRLLEILGRGGMGEVWLADRHDGQFQQRAAIKLLKRGMDSDAVLRRFVLEQQILARLEHPGIARLIDGGMTASGLPYFAMEYVQGLTITEFANQHALDLRARVRLIVDLCIAVDFANRRLIVHRDLKPGNILVLADGALKVLDFGIAKQLDQPAESTLTQASAHPMSPAYAAPEQILGESVAVGTDVYAIGLVLFELLCGSLPQSRKTCSMAEIRAEISRDICEKPSAVQRQARSDQPSRAARIPINSELDLIVLQALRREPEQRYRSAAELAEDLQCWLELRPIRARPATLAYRLQKFLRRNRVAAMVAAVAMLAIFFALWAVVEQRASAVRSAHRAEIAAQRAQRAKQFMVSLFDRANVYSKESQGARSVVDLMEAMPARLIAELDGEPSIQVDLLVEIGSSLRVIGREDSAEAALRQALVIADAAPEVAPVARAAAMREVAFIENYRGDLVAARDRLEAALAILLKQPGDQRAAMISTRTGLAHNASLRGAFEESLRMREAIVRDRKALMGERDPDVAMDYSNLATSLSDMGRYPEAALAFEHAHALLADVLGPKHPRTLFVLRNLAEVQIHQGRFREAQMAIETVLRDGDSSGTESSRGSARLVLARIAYYRARWDESAHEIEAVLGIETSTAVRIRAYRQLGRVRIQQRRFDLAAISLQQALTAMGTDSAASMPYAWTKFHYQAARHGMEPNMQSLTTVREAFAVLMSAAGTGGNERFESGLLMGRIERDAGAYARALEIHRAALASTEQHVALGTLGQALAHAEIAFDLLARNAPGDRQAARASAARALGNGADIYGSDPRFAGLSALLAAP